MKLKILLIFYFTILCISVTKAELFSKSALSYSAGIGVYDSNYLPGGGPIFSFGYQYDIWKNRLRINPAFSMGYSNSKFVTDVPDNWLNSMNFETILYFDLLKLKGLSLTIGGGGVINRTCGLIGTGGELASRNYSHYYKKWNCAAYFGGGIRINPPKSRFGIELMPLNFHVGANDYMVAYTKTTLFIKLK